MPTLRGWVFLAVSAAVAAAGLVRDELGAMVWGIALLLVQLVVVLAAVVGGARLRRARDGFAVELAEPVVEAGGSARVRVTAPRLALPPGFVLTHDLALAWRGRRLAGSAEARPAATTDWRLAVGARGDYRSTSSVLSLRDVFGFTASRIAAPATTRGA